MKQDTLFDTVEMKRYSTVFFKFVPGEKQDELMERLVKVKAMGIQNVLASYEDKQLKEVRFEDDYYKTLPELAAACEKLEMTFWLEDYSPFPTGSANGAFREEEHARWNKLYVDERHMDIRGPVKDAVIRIDAVQNVVYGKAMHCFSRTDPSCRNRLGVVAWQIRDNEEGKFAPSLKDGTAMLLDEKIEDGYLRWDIPEGYWRLFVLFTTYEGAGRPYYMNLLSRESVALEIEKVHKPIYACLKEYLGRGWNGFFYDETEIGNSGGSDVFDFFMLPGRRTSVKDDCDVYPWSVEVPGELEKRDAEWIRKLPCLWYDAGQEHIRFRLDYMDTVTSLVRDNYNGQVL